MPDMEIRFSRTQAAIHGVLAAGMAGAGMFLTSQFIFHLKALRPGSGRRAWLWDLLKIGNGWPGILLFAATSCACLWWCYLAVSRGITKEPAISLSGTSLRLNGIYGRDTIVSVSRLEEVAVYEEIPQQLLGLFPSIDTLLLRWTAHSTNPPTRKRIKIRSNTVEGGRAALVSLEKILRTSSSDT